MFTSDKPVAVADIKTTILSFAANGIFKFEIEFEAIWPRVMTPVNSFETRVFKIGS